MLPPAGPGEGSRCAEECPLLPPPRFTGRVPGGPSADRKGREGRRPDGGPLVSKQRKRLKKEVRSLDAETSSPAEDAALHEVRKSAKRLRYAAEAAAPVFGKPASALARAAEEIQEILGDHHDSVVTRDLLRELAASGPGTDAFTYGRLHSLEQQAGEESRGTFFRTWSSSPPGPSTGDRRLRAPGR
ncbi:CHAD domain-containing protein [Arthrobacter sp. OVS8]|nr:CHAD domain-containing protein [Arthrobacter sp. OVS8]